MEKQFTYIFNGEEKSKEQFAELTKDSFKWFSNSSINAVDFDSLSNFFNGSYKSNSEINKHFKGVLDSYEKIQPKWLGKCERVYSDEFTKQVEAINKCSKDDVITNNSRGEKEMIGHFQGIKETEGKLHYELSWEFIEEMAKRMANNKSDKYPLYNWKKEINIQDLKDAINRHHIEVMKGNYADGDEILGHIVSYACNSMMLWEQLNKNKFGY